MSDTINVSSHSPRTGSDGQLHLAAGEHVALRLWDETPADTADKTMHASDYETVGYVLEGTATLHLDGKAVSLQQGDSWLVPKGVQHRYEVTSHFRAVEATSPPARHR